MEAELASSWPVASRSVGPCCHHRQHICDACATLLIEQQRLQAQKKKEESRRHWSIVPVFSMTSLHDILDSRKPERPTMSDTI